MSCSMIYCASCGAMFDHDEAHACAIPATMSDERVRATLGTGMYLPAPPAPEPAPINRQQRRAAACKAVRA